MIIVKNLIFFFRSRYFLKEIESPCFFRVIDSQNVERTSVTHSAIALCATFLFLPHFDVICDLLLNRRTITWNPFVKWKHGCKPIRAHICVVFPAKNYLVHTCGSTGSRAHRCHVCFLAKTTYLITSHAHFFTTGKSFYTISKI